MLGTDLATRSDVNHRLRQVVGDECDPVTRPLRSEVGVAEGGRLAEVALVVAGDEGVKARLLLEDHTVGLNI